MFIGIALDKNIDCNNICHKIQEMINWYNKNDPLDSGCILKIEIKRSKEVIPDLPKLEYHG
jgi:hypothetical protein